jgi:hypothetical protein
MFDNLFGTVYREHGVVMLYGKILEKITDDVIMTDLGGTHG